MRDSLIETFEIVSRFARSDEVRGICTGGTFEKSALKIST